MPREKPDFDSYALSKTIYLVDDFISRVYRDNTYCAGSENNKLMSRKTLTLA